MNKSQFMEKLEELKSHADDSDYSIYRLDLCYEGVYVGCIYADGDLDSIEVDDRETYVLIYTNTFGILVDDAEIGSI